MTAYQELESGGLESSRAEPRWPIAKDNENHSYESLVNKIQKQGWKKVTISKWFQAWVELTCSLVHTREEYKQLDIKWSVGFQMLLYYSIIFDFFYQIFVNWYAWQTGTEISTKNRFSNGFPGRMQNSSKCRKIIFLLWKFQLGAKTSDNWRSDQSNSCEKQVIMVCEWYCEIHREASFTHPIFVTKKKWLAYKNEKSDVYERKYVRGADWLFPFL